VHAAEQEGKRHELLLFVSGATPRSLRTVAAVRKLCERFLSGLYTLDVIDAFRDPEFARDCQIVALPTLLRLKPTPKLLLVGDMSDPGPLVAGLGLAP
jgi:circadian clock protein KaiB